MNSFQLPNGVYHIPLELPWSTPGNVNVYLLEEDDGYVMIDCGVDGSEYLKLLEMHLSELNITFGEYQITYWNAYAYRPYRTIWETKRI